ncbi:MAG: HlyD family secretion protein [Bryobacteraceae bacterium]
MNARNRVFLVLGLLMAGSLAWYLLTARPPGDLKLIGTVDANEVIVSSKIPGRIQTLTVEEGQKVKAGDLIAVIECEDLDAAYKAAHATAASQKSKLNETIETHRQTLGETESQLKNAEATLRAARANELQANANFEHQRASTRRIEALAAQGIASEQAKDEAVTSLQAAEAALAAARENTAAAEAALNQARAHQIQAAAAAHTVVSTRDMAANAAALEDQARVGLTYARVVAPVSGTVDVRAARQGEVVAAGAPIATLMDLTQTWVYAPLPETNADSVQLGDQLRVVMPSGAAIQGKIIAKSAVADFATQRDINGGRKRDIRTMRLKLLIDNPGERFVPGMTAEVFIPKEKLSTP